MTGKPVVETAREGAWIVVAWHGDIDMANAPALEHETLEAVINTDEELTVDLSDVTYIDSAGIRSLVSMRRSLSERQQRLSVIVPDGSLLMKALEVGGVTTIIPVHRSREAARSSR